MATDPRKTNRLLLLEVGMALVFIVLGIVYYLRPVGEGELGARWWIWGSMALLFFAIAGLHTWRRRRSALSALHQAIREEAAKREG